LVQQVLDEAGVDLASRLYASTDPVMAQYVIPRLDCSHENPIEGVTKWIVPLPWPCGNSHEKDLCLEPHTKVRWHCHKDAFILHVITQGELTLERLLRSDAGEVIRDAEGKPTRMQSRLKQRDYWIAPPGEPYSYWTGEVRACTRYKHMGGTGLETEACLDPDAFPET
jgi:hypothetical protein